jgi:uncharacterized protein HemY
VPLVLAVVLLLLLLLLVLLLSMGCCPQQGYLTLSVTQYLMRTDQACQVLSSSGCLGRG